jgi:putative sugar O-methyltransferase
MKKNLEFNYLLDKFLDNSNLENDLKQNVDGKHKTIITKSLQSIHEKEINYFNFKHNENQNDLGSPPQFSWLHFKVLGFFLTLKNFFRLFTYSKIDKIAFLDDVKILEISGAFNFLKKNPVHITPGCRSFYKIRETSTNYRWNRYAYLANQIKKFNILKDDSAHLDIGSYYGGLQSFLKKEFLKTNFVLVDFNHQLLRSFIFLRKIFSNSKHILPNEIDENTDFSKFNDAFFYVPVEKFDLIKNNKFKLITNFFSFGEMIKSDFENYLNSDTVKNAQYLYFVNRFVSSPFFERTYNNNINIMDYLLSKNHFNINYFDMFPIHHYYSPKRKLFNQMAHRPISSPYFEILYEKKS